MNLFTVQCEVNYKLSANKTINLFPVQNRNLKKKYIDNVYDPKSY